MSSKKYDTIIIGAGISGLSCAKQLQKSDNDFLIISKDVGGRILTSKDGAVNYGAFFVCSDYYNVLPFVKIKSRIRLRDFCFHDSDEQFVLFEPKLLKYFLQFGKIIRILYKFRRAFRQFRKNSENISQKKAIENDSYLRNLYMKDAFDFVKENKLLKGTEAYLSKALYSTTFSKIQEMNAFSYLQFLLPLITPIYSFEFKEEKMTRSFHDNIVIDDVLDIKFKNNEYEIISKNNSFISKHLVIATDICTSKNWIGLKKTNKPVNTHMLHIKGKLKETYYSKKYHLFSPSSNIQAIADIGDGTYLLYYKKNFPKMDKIFITPDIISSHFWKPAGTINGHILIDSDQGNNLYIIGDYNVAGLEESYITGLYAANKIINSDHT